MKRQQAFEKYAENRKMLKGELHSHTVRSDGRLTPEEVERRYREKGFDFLAITDHRVYNYKDFAPELGLTIIPGMELNNKNSSIPCDHGFRCFHTVCVGPSREDGNGYEQDQRVDAPEAKDQEEYQPHIDEVHAKKNLTVHCHPEWSCTPAHYFENIEGNFAMEIYNHSSAVGCDMDKDAAYWDELLGKGKRIYGVATDDSHSIADLGGGYVMVNSENDVNSILEALAEGRFYSSSGPEIYDFYVDGDTAYVDCSPAATVRIHSDGHPTRITRDAGGEMTHAEFKIKDVWPGPYMYVRASVVDKDGKIAWTNPIYLDKELDKE